MKRDLHELAGERYDLLVIGGGISGVCAAWDAALRGLSVALLEQADFAHAASGNCFKMIHGGIRYLQHADLVRARESAAERSALLRIAPHQSRPLPIFIPTYGHGMKGKEILFAGMKAYDLLTLDRNRGIGDPSRRIPSTFWLQIPACSCATARWPGYVASGARPTRRPSSTPLERPSSSRHRCPGSASASPGAGAGSRR